ncbi:unnamed protein product [Dracunculus medinensis]|uniref:Ras-GEF domain-containing protein n=1 Tax=Dracunculus medinensis TaxID=318479 RepID=A0A0N4U8D3_DRAME|nr:unnamed protein product [Dracunculus medinensis]
MCGYYDPVRIAHSHNIPILWYIHIGYGASTIHSNDYSNLSQILQISESDRIRLPKRFVDNEEENVGEESVEYSEFLPISSSSVLEQIDSTDWLVLRANDGISKPHEVRGGPVDALIAYATQPNGSLLYQEAFLTTYRTFISSTELIDKLIRRYIYMSLSDAQSFVKVARQSFSMLVRVVDELCAVEIIRELVRTITKFINRLIGDGNYTFAKLLRMPSLFEFRSSAIAKQMTYLDAELFQKIEPAEMLWWSMEQNEKKSPNLCSFTEHFNKQLRTMGNYNSYLAILSALDSGPIRRLDWSKNALDMLKDHSSIMDSSHSFKNYRTLLSESLPPCLPYIGLVLQDLTFVHIGNTNYLAPENCNYCKNLINFGKRWQQFAILDSIRRFKSWNYSIEKDDKILYFFQDFKNYLSEDDIWELSETIKPRLRRNK